jgi:hypothetical protein
MLRCTLHDKQFKLSLYPAFDTSCDGLASLGEGPNVVGNGRAQQQARVARHHGF